MDIGARNAVLVCMLLVAAGQRVGAQAAVQERSAPAAARACHEFSFEGRANGGEAYSRQLGGGLWLRLLPEGNEGWMIEIHKGNGDDDYGFPLNPPFHFGNSQYMATGYGLTVEELLKDEREIFFSPTEEERQRAVKFYEDTVENDNSPESATKFLAGLSAMISAVVKFKPLQHETTDEGQSVSWVQFSITVIVPKNFQVPPDVSIKDAVCPSGL